MLDSWVLLFWFAVMEEKKENVAKLNWAIKLYMCPKSLCLNVGPTSWRYETTFGVPCAPVHPPCFEATKWRPSFLHRSGRDHSWSPAAQRLGCEVAWDATSTYVCVGAHSVCACATFDVRIATQVCQCAYVCQGRCPCHTYLYILTSYFR